jgi:transposase InsO family protein
MGDGCGRRASVRQGESLAGHHRIAIRQRQLLIFLATPAASPATSVLNRERHPSKVHKATEWLKPSFYVRVNPRPDAETVMRELSSWFTHYNEVHPHKALGYRSPCEFHRNSWKSLTVSGRSGATTPVAYSAWP